MILDRFRSCHCFCITINFGAASLTTCVRLQHVHRRLQSVLRVLGTEWLEGRMVFQVTYETWLQTPE